MEHTKQSQQRQQKDKQSKVVKEKYKQYKWWGNQVQRDGGVAEGKVHGKANGDVAELFCDVTVESAATKCQTEPMRTEPKSLQTLVGARTDRM